MCGIIALWNSNQNKTLENLIQKLKRLQHRGQDSFGYGYLTLEQELKVHKEPGLVRDYNPNQSLESTNFALGHLRYSTSGSAKGSNESQPLGNQDFLLCHNGNLPNHSQLEKDLGFNQNQKWEGSDTQLLSLYLEHLYQKHQNWKEVMERVMRRIPGVYCLLLLTKDGLWIARDRYGLRPLLISNDKDNGWVIGSESLIFDDNQSFRNLEPGSLSYLRPNGQLTTTQIYQSCLTPCIFEYIYFLNPNSIIEDHSVAEFRSRCGELLAKKECFKFNSDYIVIAAPSTGLISAERYAEVLNLNYRPETLEKRKKACRTFILENDQKRINACLNKYNFNDALIKNSKIILVDDSLVRGNTLKVINQILREKGAQEIHIRIASPPVKSPCYFGINIPTKEELIANSYLNQDNTLDTDELGNVLGADSLIYLDLEDMSKAFNKKRFCSSCFDGKYNSKLLDW